MKIYLASPFFNDREIQYVKQAEKILRGRGFEVYSPREHEVRNETVGSVAWSKTTFLEDRYAIDICDVVVALYHGNYSDTGTAWECGYAYGIDTPVIIVHLGENSNLMMHEGCRSNITMDELEDFDFEKMPVEKYVGEMM